MKTNQLTRTAAVVVSTLAFALVSAFATPTVTLKIGGKDKNGDSFEFGKGLEINATSGSWRLSASKAYSYKVVGTCSGTGAMAKLVPPGTPISALLNTIKPGSGGVLSGVYANPGGKLNFKAIDRTVQGVVPVSGLGNVTFSAKIVAGTTGTGEVYLNVTNVSFTSTKSSNLGTIKFDTGAKFIINTAPQIQFKAKGQTPFGESSGSIQISVTRFGFTKTSSTIDYVTVDGTASSIADQDFTATSGTLTFPKNVTELFVTIPITDNATIDGSRKFTIVLSNPKSGSVIGKNPVNTVVISDND